jgi:hypothetical protein
VLWSAPPVLFVAWLASGTFLYNPMAWFLGIITVPYAVWWLRQVWTRVALPIPPTNTLTDHRG